ncbi:Uncharacterised protein [Bordetella pertussis]|nr:Uncharacterised protein [Bordetella pertussis]
MTSQARLKGASRSGSSPAFSARTASLSISLYIEKPTSWMLPDCESPRISPVPRISRSCMAR